MANWLSRLFFGPTGGALPLGAASGTPMGTGLVSPWQDSSTLAHIAYSELFGGASDIVDRSAAMTVAPVKRGRAIIVGSIADLPLLALKDGKPIQRQPRWLTRTNTVVTCWHRIADTVDDLIFHGWALWTVQRGEGGEILDALRIPFSQWSFDENTPLGVKVKDQPVTDPRSVILFQGPDDGLLRTGADVIRGARAMEAAWVGRVQNPIPAMVLHEVERNGVTEAEARQYVDVWSAARTSPNGAVGFLPAQLNMEVYGETATDLFTEGRNNVRLDVANLLNLPASVLDGSTATASLTYQTAQGEFSQLNAWLEYWLAPIEHRLSQNDVSPNGQLIRFARGNLSALTNLGPEPLPDAAIEPAAAPTVPELEVAA
jgi:hypothetical protein